MGNCLKRETGCEPDPSYDVGKIRESVVIISILLNKL
jgi:hypothetical protein